MIGKYRILFIIPLGFSKIDCLHISSLLRADVDIIVYSRQLIAHNARYTFNEIIWSSWSNDLDKATYHDL